MISLGNVCDRLSKANVHLIEKVQHISISDLEQRFPDGRIAACDFYVTHIEEGEEVTAGYELGRILNIDHHAPMPRMAHAISSTNLAIAMVNEQGPLPDAATVINHTDCDSVLSCAIVSGVLEPLPIFGEAAIIADHRGDENDISDLLQGLGPKRDLPYSLENLRRLLAGEALQDEAQIALDKRRAKRDKAREVVESGAFRQVGKLAFAVLPERFDGELFPPLLPEAALLMFAAPLKEDPSKWVVKVRMGRNAPDGLNINDLGVRQIDKSFGGRWNAGSNTRGGGTDIDPEHYAERLSRNLDQVLSEFEGRPEP